MKKRIFIIAATELELAPVRNILLKAQLPFSFSFHLTGVGLLGSTYALLKLIYREDIGAEDWVFGVGIAGSFSEKLAIKQVVWVAQDQVDRCGADEGGRFCDVFDMGLIEKDVFPYQDKLLSNPYAAQLRLGTIPSVRAVTGNEMSTQTKRIDFLRRVQKAEIETMEGAAWHYVCLLEKINFIQIRAISNFVGVRDKAQWFIQESLTELAKNVLEVIQRSF